MSKPMVIAIAGVSGSGKTSLSQALGTLLGWPRLSFDDDALVGRPSEVEKWARNHCEPADAWPTPNLSRSLNELLTAGGAPAGIIIDEPFGRHRLQVQHLIHRVIYLDISGDQAVVRMMQREFSEFLQSGNKSREDIIAHVERMHRCYLTSWGVVYRATAIARLTADFIIDACLPVEQVLAQALAYLQAELSAYERHS